jgi:hypothetical protein
LLGMKVMTAAFWDFKRVIFVDVMLRGDTVTADSYSRAVKELWKCFKLFWLDRWTVLPHPPYSFHLTSSDFHLFGALKDSICDKKFQSNKDVTGAPRTNTQTHGRARARAHTHTLFLMCAGP